MQELVGKPTLRDKRWKDPSNYSENRKVVLRFHNLPYYDHTLSDVLNEAFPSVYFDENLETSRMRERSYRPLVIFHGGGILPENEFKNMVLSYIEIRSVGIPVLVVMVWSEKEMLWINFPQSKEYKDIQTGTIRSPKIMMVQKKKSTDGSPTETHPDIIRFNTLFFVGFSQWLAGVTGAQEVEIARPRSILSDVIWRDEAEHLRYVVKSTKEGEEQGLQDAEIYATLRYNPTREERHEPVFIFGKIFEDWAAQVKEKLTRAEEFIEGGGRSVSSRPAPKKPVVTQPPPKVQPDQSSFFEEMVPSPSLPSSSSFSSSSESSQSTPPTSDTLLTDDDLSQSEEAKPPIVSPSLKKPSRSRSRSKPVPKAAEPVPFIFSHLLTKAPAKQSTVPSVATPPQPSSSSSSPSDRDMDTPFSSLLRTGTSTLKRPEAPVKTVDETQLSESEDDYMPQRQRVENLIGESIGIYQQKLGALMQQLTRVNMGDVQRGFRK